MKTIAPKRMTALLMALVLSFSLSACSASKDTAQEDSVAVTNTVSAKAGGTVTLPDGFAAPQTSNSIATQLTGSTLAGAFTLTNYRTTGYFTTNGSITVTVKATLETGGVKTKWTDATFAIWKQGSGTTQYLKTIHFTADGTPYSYTLSGLDAGAKYRVTFAYSDVPKYKLSGTFNIAEVTSQTGEEVATAKE